MDISGDFLKAQAEALRKDFPGLGVYPVAADFTAPFTLPDAVGAMPKVGFFPGSTLGNFEPHEACGFLRSARDILGQGAQMVIGVDLDEEIVKQHLRPDSAYFKPTPEWDKERSNDRHWS